MIEQVLYRRGERGYSLANSHGLSNNEAELINSTIGSIAPDVDELGSGMDSPFLIYPFHSIQKYCIAIFQRELSGGRKTALNHGIVIDEKEYGYLIKEPEKLWGFSNKNFMARNANSRNELVSLREFAVVENAELDKELIFQEFHLKNEGYIHFLNAIYTSLSQNKNYTFAIIVDKSKDSNKIMRRLGYLLMSMLPYELRNKISFFSRSVAGTSNVTVQILREGDFARVDITYDLNTKECVVNSNVEITDFYLNDLMDMSDEALREHFAVLNAFKEDLSLTKDSKAQYVVSKLLKLSQNPELFRRETAKEQLTIINDALSLPTSNTDVIHPIVIRLLPYVDVNYHMEVFQINFELYTKRNTGSGTRMLSQLKNNLLQNYFNATSEEKVTLFNTILESNQVNANVLELLMKFADVNDAGTDKKVIDSYMKLYEEYFSSEWMQSLCKKIVSVFYNSKDEEKIRIWNYMNHSKNREARALFIHNAFQLEDEPFQKAIFKELVKIFQEFRNSETGEGVYSRIMDVIRQENDEYRIQVLRQYNDANGLEDTLWLDTYNEVKDVRSISSDAELINCLKEKYLNSLNPKIRDLYLKCILSAPASELEHTILSYADKPVKTKRDEELVNKVMDSLIQNKQKVSVPTLKILGTKVMGGKLDEFTSYIQNTYLSESSDSSIEVYKYLEAEQRNVFHSSELNKENLPSYDYYYASTLSKEIIKNDQRLLEVLRELETLRYNSVSFEKIHSLFQALMEEGFSAVNADFERYQFYLQILNRLEKIQHTRFGYQFSTALKQTAKEEFWAASDASSFDIQHCEIYRRESDVFSPEFSQHKNHILAENVKGFISNLGVDWDKAYGILLSRESIPDDDVRNRIIHDFMNQYMENQLPVTDTDYIAFSNVEPKTLEMNYTALFDDLHRANFPIDALSIKRLSVFKYIHISEQLKKIVSEYKNFRSENPHYKEVFRGLLIGQMVLVLLLPANNILRLFALRMPDDSSLRNGILFWNYTGYKLMMVGVVAVVIVMMLRANLRNSAKFDIYVYGLLIVSLMCSMLAIIISVSQTRLILCLPIPVLLIVVSIALNIKVADVVGKTRSQVML